MGALLEGLEVLWVRVVCAGQIAAGREALRSDRVAGMAVSQAEVVHEGMTYNVQVDSGVMTPDECAAAIVCHLWAGR